MACTTCRRDVDLWQECWRIGDWDYLLKEMIDRICVKSAREDEGCVMRHHYSTRERDVDECASMGKRVCHGGGMHTRGPCDSCMEWFDLSHGSHQLSCQQTLNALLCGGPEDSLHWGDFYFLLETTRNVLSARQVCIHASSTFVALN